MARSRRHQPAVPARHPTGLTTPCASPRPQAARIAPKTGRVSSATRNRLAHMRTDAAFGPMTKTFLPDPGSIVRTAGGGPANRGKPRPADRMRMLPQPRIIDMKSR